MGCIQRLAHREAYQRATRQYQTEDIERRQKLVAAGGRDGGLIGLILLWAWSVQEVEVESALSVRRAV